jgi:hypothetical protein
MQQNLHTAPCPRAAGLPAYAVAWPRRNRRLTKDFERTMAGVEAWFLIASRWLLNRRLAEPKNAVITFESDAEETTT